GPDACMPGNLLINSVGEATGGHSGLNGDWFSGNLNDPQIVGPSLPAGTYEVQASYAGDVNNEAASSACGSEQLTVARAQPTITTQLCSSSITPTGVVSDDATVSGASPDATGFSFLNVFPGSGPDACMPGNLLINSVGEATGGHSGLNGDWFSGNLNDP